MFGFQRVADVFRGVLFVAGVVSVFVVNSADSSAKATTLSSKDIDRIAEVTAQKTAEKVMTALKKQSLELATTPPLKHGTTAESDAQSPSKFEGLEEANIANGIVELPDSTVVDNRMLLMGSGSVGGNYFVLGELIGGVISHPNGSLPCGQGGTCGIEGVQAINLTSAGSLANLQALKAGKISSGFAQSDIAYWAYTGTGVFAGKEKNADLRAIASLYPEAMHIVVRKDLNLQSVADLKGKRVSVGSRNSGTLSLARIVLEAYNLAEDDLKTEYLNNQQSIAKLKKGELDAMFFSVGAPAPAFTHLFDESDDFTLLSIDRVAQKKIFQTGHYFSQHTIDAGVYHDVPEVDTVSVFALWLCSANLDEELVYKMTKALWGHTSRQLLDSSYIGEKVNIKNSLKGIGIPLHKGAKRYYNEIGKRY